METPQPDSLHAPVQETLELSKENNRLLKAIRRDAIIGAVLKFIIWLIVIGVSIYFTMQFLNPLLEGAMGANQENLKLLLDFYNGEVFK